MTETGSRETEFRGEFSELDEAAQNQVLDMARNLARIAGESERNSPGQFGNVLGPRRGSPEKVS